MAKEINYVIGYPWNTKKPNDLCIYTYRTEIQSGTMAQAKNFLEYVKRNSEKEDKDKYAIYTVTFTKVD